MQRIRPLIIGTIVLLVCIAAYSYYHPAIDAGIRLIGRKADSHELKKVDQADPKLEKFVGGDDRTFGAALRDFGSEDGARRSDREAALARATNKIPVTRQPFVAGNQNNWKTFFPAHEDILVTVGRNDSVCRTDKDGECYRADGPYIGFLERYIDHAKLVVQDPQYGGDPKRSHGAYGALIAHTCSDDNTCSPIVETGFTFAVCGASHPGELQLWTNRATIVGPAHHVEDFASASGGYSFEARPDATAVAVCSKHPGTAIVPISSQ